MADRPRVLIEDWLPVAELGIESRRERAAASALPAALVPSRLVGAASSRRLARELCWAP